MFSENPIDSSQGYLHRHNEVLLRSVETIALSSSFVEFGCLRLLSLQDSDVGDESNIQTMVVVFGNTSDVCVASCVGGWLHKRDNETQGEIGSKVHCLPCTPRS